MNGRGKERARGPGALAVGSLWRTAGGRRGTRRLKSTGLDTGLDEK